MSGTVLQQAVSKSSRRLVWFLMLLYFFAILDRVNVGVAGAEMRSDLGLDAASFGLGAGIFFLGYLLLEVPSNLLLERFGARVWLARIVVTWGIAAMAMALAVGPKSFVALRFLLGVAEAGFFPGIMFCMTLWFPAQNRARMNALFFLGVPLSNSIAAALSSLLLQMGGTFHLAGWQWLFVLEGAPPVLLGLLVLVLLPDRPSSARWLSTAEKQAIEEQLAAERRTSVATTDLRRTMLSPLVWLLGIAYFGVNASLAALGMWLPQLIQGLGHYSVVGSGLISAGVLLPGALAMFLWSRHSDRTQERVMHGILAASVAALGWLLCAASPSPVVGIALLTVASAGTYATMGIFWTFPAALLAGRAAAGGIALIGAIGNLGGFIGPYAIGQIRASTGSFAGGFVVVALVLLATAIIVWRAGGRAFRPAMMLAE